MGGSQPQDCEAEKRRNRKLTKKRHVGQTGRKRRDSDNGEVTLNRSQEITGQYFYSFTVRDGDDVTLPCGNVRDDQNKCDSTTWIFSESGNKAAVTLFELGQIKKDSVKSKSDRLSVTENCSLVIKKVTDEDVGRYICRQFISGRQQGGDSEVDLSVATSEEATKSMTTITEATSAQTNTRNYSIKRDRTEPQGRSWWYIVIAAIIATLLLTVGVFVISLSRCKKTEEIEPQLYENMERRFHPALTENWNLDLGNYYGNVGAVTYNTKRSFYSSGESLSEPIYETPN
ncbi:uncharacterized protein LOC113149645 [Anabas testudineus]|uniref:uncharacterized protein LOC113149645 n=1 Tax=Anabas testudineus TaxID=64144 RepID=UPI000E45437F|nr:uncharacterized protein LOC113149645 [Anabas testudineus]